MTPFKLLYSKRSSNASFPLIAKANSQARCENFNQSQYLKALAASLRVDFCDEWKRGITRPLGI